jgi:hypothetical protein
MDATLIGYVPKRTAKTPDWLDVSAVFEICSASHCISKGPDDWTINDLLNEASLFDNEATALSSVSEASRGDFEIYAFALYPVLIAETGERSLPIPTLSVAPLPTDFRSLGYDAVSNSGISGPINRTPDTIWFECSPLSCNSRATDFAVNEHCLLNSSLEAIQAAKEFAKVNAEPGPYLVAQVFRKDRNL